MSNRNRHLNLRCDWLAPFSVRLSLKNATQKEPKIKDAAPTLCAEIKKCERSLHMKKNPFRTFIMQPYIYIAYRLICHVGASICAGLGANSFLIGMSVGLGLAVVLFGIDMLREDIYKIHSATK